MGDVVQMNGEGFFQSLTGLDADEAIQRCKVRGDEWRADIEHLREKLAATPRGDKQGAHEIKQAIMRIESRLRRLRPVMNAYRATQQSKESHCLWADAVRSICGNDVLGDVYEWMKVERKRRKLAHLSVNERRDIEMGLNNEGATIGGDGTTPADHDQRAYYPIR